jgi:transcriptional regulator with XRE-family HTH domain
MPPMARFGQNLRALRKTVKGLSQKLLADQILRAEGHPLTQSTVAKLERSEFPPMPDTVQRIAEGVAKATSQPVDLVITRLLLGVPARFDAIHSARAASERAWIDRLSDLISQQEPAKRPALLDALERHAEEWVKRSKRAQT